MASLEDLTPEQQAQALNLWNFVRENPEVGKDIRRAAKKKNPAMSAPDIEMEEALAAQAKELREEMAKERQERLDAITAERRKEAHAKIKAEGLEPDKVEDVMVKENIGNYETAIRYVKSQQTVAPATPNTLTPMQMPDQKDLWKDKNKFARATAFDAITEVMQRRRSAG